MADRYWVGGNGTWSQTTRWSTSSGGAGGASVPTSSDHVRIDANSGSPTIGINAAAVAGHLLISSGVTCTINATSGLTLHGFGGFSQLQLSAGTTLNGSVTISTVGCLATRNGATVSANLTLNKGLAFMDNWNCGTITINEGTLDLGSGRSHVCGGLITAGAATKSMTFGSSATTIRVGGQIANSGTNFTVVATTSGHNIEWDSTFSTFTTGGIDWGSGLRVGLKIVACFLNTISGGGTFAAVTVTPAITTSGGLTINSSTQMLSLTWDTACKQTLTLTGTTLTLTGASSSALVLAGINAANRFTVTGGAFSILSGGDTPTIECPYLAVSSNTVTRTGAAITRASVDSTRSGTCTGWCFDFMATKADNLGITDVIQGSGSDRTASVNDNLGLTDSVSTAATPPRLVEDYLNVSDAIRVTLDRLIPDSFIMFDRGEGVLYTSERLGLTDGVQATLGTSSVSRNDNLGITDLVSYILVGGGGSYNPAANPLHTFDATLRPLRFDEMARPLRFQDHAHPSRFPAASTRPLRFHATVFVREESSVDLETVEFGPYTQNEIPEPLWVQVYETLRDGTTQPLTLYAQTPAWVASMTLVKPSGASTTRVIEILNPASLNTEEPDSFTGPENGWLRIQWLATDFTEIGGAEEYELQIVLDNGVLLLKSTTIYSPHVRTGPAAAFT
jgi:hypothetical protein